MVAEQRTTLAFFFHHRETRACKEMLRERYSFTWGLGVLSWYFCSSIRAFISTCRDFVLLQEGVDLE